MNDIEKNRISISCKNVKLSFGQFYKELLPSSSAPLILNLVLILKNTLILCLVHHHLTSVPWITTNKTEKTTANIVTCNVKSNNIAISRKLASELVCSYDPHSSTRPLSMWNNAKTVTTSVEGKRNYRWKPTRNFSIKYSDSNRTPSVLYSCWLQTHHEHPGKWLIGICYGIVYTKRYNLCCNMDWWIL